MHQLLKELVRAEALPLTGWSPTSLSVVGVAMAIMVRGEWGRPKS